MKKKYNWDDIKQLYLEKKLSSEDIAKLKGCSGVRVREKLREQNVILRGKKEANLLAFSQVAHKRPQMSASPNWKGGRYKTNYGYIEIYLPNHPFAHGKGYVFEHRLVVEKRLGRYLLPSEKVHHHNGVRDDNRDDNLDLISVADHVIKNFLCAGCPLRKEVKRITEELSIMKKALQGKFPESEVRS